MTLTAATHRAIDAVGRIESAKVIAGVARLVRDVDLAPEQALDALVAALEPIVEGLRDEPTLAPHHLLPSVRGDLLAKLGRSDEAGAEFARAADMTRNALERRLLLERAALGSAP